MENVFISFKEFLLLEAPELVGDTNFNLDNEKANVALGKKLLASKDLELIDDLTYGYKLYRSRRYYFMTLKAEPKLYYFMKYTTKRISMLREDAASQIVVWTSNDGPKITSRVFFDYLLKEHHLVATDRQQTDAGARFWKFRVEEALKKDLFVYFGDLLTQTLVRIHTLPELADLKGEVWGHHQKFQAAKLLISDHELKPKDHVKVED